MKKKASEVNNLIICATVTPSLPVLLPKGDLGKCEVKF